MQLIQSIAGRPLVFMHITKSLIKSTSNCRHRNQSQLPHRHRNPWTIPIRNRVRSPRWSVECKNCQYVKADIRIKKRNAMDCSGLGPNPSPGPGECGALFFYKFALIKIPINANSEGINRPNGLSYYYLIALPNTVRVK